MSTMFNDAQTRGWDGEAEVVWWGSQEQIGDKVPSDVILAEVLHWRGIIAVVMILTFRRVANKGSHLRLSKQNKEKG